MHVVADRIVLVKVSFRLTGQASCVPTPAFEIGYVLPWHEIMDMGRAVLEALAWASLAGLMGGGWRADGYVDDTKCSECNSHVLKNILWKRGRYFPAPRHKFGGC